MPSFNSSIASICAIHFWSTTFNITTLSSSLISFSPISCSFLLYLSNISSFSSSNTLDSLLDSFRLSSSSIPKWVLISAISPSVFDSVADIWLETIASAVYINIFIILSFKSSPLRTCFLSLYIISLWVFITSSYCNTCFLILKCLPSILFCAFSTLLDKIPISSGMFSSTPIELYTLVTMSPPNIFIKSSSSAM